MRSCAPRCCMGSCWATAPPAPLTAPVVTAPAAAAAAAPAAACRLLRLLPRRSRAWRPPRRWPACACLSTRRGGTDPTRVRLVCEAAGAVQCVCTLLRNAGLCSVLQCRGHRHAPVLLHGCVSAAAPAGCARLPAAHALPLPTRPGPTTPATCRPLPHPPLRLRRAAAGLLPRSGGGGRGAGAALRAGGAVLR